MTVLFATPLVFIVLWLGLRLRFRQALFASVLIGLVADAVLDYLLVRVR